MGHLMNMVPPARLELATFWFEARRSIQLRYEGIYYPKSVEQMKMQVKDYYDEKKCGKYSSHFLFILYISLYQSLLRLLR